MFFFQPLSSTTYPRFLKTLPVLAVEAAVGFAAAAAAFFVAVAATPFLIVPITDRFAAAGARVVAMAVAGRFLTTVDVLPSLDSLTPLTLRVVRVGGLEGGAAGCPMVRLGFDAVVVVALRELAVVEAVVLARVRAFPTMLLIMLVAVAILVGETGRAMLDLTGDAAGRSRGAIRELEEAGERT
jgi:hypothetical protein